MISISKNVLDMNKLYQLLLERQSSIVKDFINSRVKSHDTKRYSHFEIVNDEANLEIRYRINEDKEHYYEPRLMSVRDDSSLRLSEDGKLLLASYIKSPSLTMNDLIKFGIVDESEVAYVVTYESIDQPYSMDCGLVGVFDSFEKLKSVDMSDTPGVVDVNVVKRNVVGYTYLCGYEE